ncbi:MAG: hypothetical protein NVS1B12_00900 [Acidimicrobiales bacterium]
MTWEHSQVWSGVHRWVVRALWAALPFTAGVAFSQALRPEAAALRLTLSAGAWIAWATILVATLVPHPLGLTAFRCAAPAAATASVVAAVSGRPGPVVALIGVGATGAVALVAFLPATGIWFVNGPAYPNERRFPLAAPGALLLGPVVLAWAAVVGAPIAAAVLLSTRHWIAGGVTAATAAGAVGVLGRALYGLSRRWVVFVPAGLVLHDPASLLDPVLFKRQTIAGLGPAPADSDSLDLTQRAMGLALELRLTEKVPMTRVVSGNRRGETGASARLLFTPTRPGAVLAEAAARRIVVAPPERPDATAHPASPTA